MELDIGEHCAFTGCNTVDFLPFECKYCKHLYCKEHSSIASHSCTAVDLIANKPLCTSYGKADDEEPLTAVTAGGLSHQPSSGGSKWLCDHKGCKPKQGLNNVWCDCSKCNKTFCLRHRLPEDHVCEDKLKAAQPKKVLAARRDVGSAIVGQHPASVGNEKVSVNRQIKIKNTKRKLRAMRCRAKAKGDESIVVTNRICVVMKVAKNCYCKGKTVGDAAASNMTETKNVWLDGSKTIGWNLDYICRYLQIINKNISSNEGDILFMYIRVDDKDEENEVGSYEVLSSKSVCKEELDQGDIVLLQRGRLESSSTKADDVEQ